MSEPTPICGSNPVLPAERVGCGKPISGDVYRCTECTTPFHHECAIKHFGQHGEIVITDTTYELLLAEKNAGLAAQLSELNRISDALGTNEGHSSVDHILAMKAKIDAQRTALLALSERIRREGMQGVANEIEEIVGK